jgi:hypothetical protein
MKNKIKTNKRKSEAGGVTSTVRSAKRTAEVISKR